MNSIKYNFIPSSFDGKVVLITGSSSGFGAATALHLAKRNANLVINGRDPQKVKDVAQECRKWTQNTVIEVIIDLYRDSDVKHLVQKTVETFGRIDVLVNNAGGITQGLISDSNYLETFDKMMQINLRSIILLTSLVVPHLEATKGCIVNVSSITSHIPRRSWSAYGVSKCGLDMFTKCMAMELGSKGIRVNAINPGLVITPMLRTLKDLTFSDEEVALFCQLTYPLGRPGLVEDMANAIEFLASENSSFITGVVMPVDGGYFKIAFGLKMSEKSLIQCSKFNEKVALVTGSSAGVGKKIAELLAKLGFNLVITGRDSQRVKEVAENCRHLSKQNVLEVVADLLNDSDVQNLVNKTIEEFRRLDLLVNCAQISISCEITDPNVMDNYMIVYNTNVRSVVLLTTLALPYIEETKGCIINLSSDSGLKPYESEFAFGVSEAAIDWFTKGLALEMKHKKITVLSLNSSIVMRDDFETMPFFSVTLHSRL